MFSTFFTIILVFRSKRYGNILTGMPYTGTLNKGWV